MTMRHTETSDDDIVILRCPECGYQKRTAGPSEWVDYYCNHDVYEVPGGRRLLLVPLEEVATAADAFLIAAAPEMAELLERLVACVNQEPPATEADYEGIDDTAEAAAMLLDRIKGAS